MPVGGTTGLIREWVGQEWVEYNKMCWFKCRRSNININDVLGDYSLTLVDSLDMLAVSYN